MGNALFERLCTVGQLMSAWKRVKAKNSGGGIDGLTIIEFEKDIDRHLSELIAALRAGSWKPQPYKKMGIPKKTGETRTIGLLSLKDKTVQTAIKQIVEPRFENLFLGNSYGYRPQKGHAKAVRRSLFECQNKANQWLLRLDIDDYFDSISHDILFARLRAVIPDEEINRLIQLSVKMGMVNKKRKWEEINRGVPQGAVLSPMLANLYLHQFDQFILTRTRSYVRYADDFIILCETQNRAEAIREEATVFLKERLQLSLNAPEIGKIEDGFEFLGITLDKTGLSLSENKKRELLQRIDGLESHNGVFTDKETKLWNGIRNYYGKLLPENTLVELDKALVRKVQTMIEQQVGKIRNISVLKNGLAEIAFLSAEMQLKRKQILQQLTDTYLAVKGKKQSKIADDQNRRLINSRKTEYRKKEAEGSELVVRTPGSHIGISGQNIVVRIQGKVAHKKPSASLRHLTVTGQCVSLSSNVIRFCMDRRIPVDFFDSSVHYASVLSLKFMESTLWGQQARMTENQRFVLAKRLILGKLKNQANLVKYFQKYHKTTKEDVDTQFALTTAKLSEIVGELKELPYTEDYCEVLMGKEAQAAVCYWGYVEKLLEDDGAGFEGRVRRGATDLVNSMLNYAYSFLYNRVWQALLGEGLNPMDGVLHKRQAGKPTLVFDVVELFRAQGADRVVIGMVQRGMALKMEGNLLCDATKRILTKGVLERMNRYEKYRGEEMPFERIFVEQAKEIAAYIGSGKTFKPYIAKW
ncbi:CRISPR-associated endonuclease Cas1 [Bacteroides heparinolyticus]|uniref:CRISPR-associated endonuclease Cas1 n=1 Tax=Prevotella heparinolytica TaxID=28113 RepID=UPI0035A0C1B4